MLHVYFLCRLSHHEAFAEVFPDLANGDRVAKSSALKWLKSFIGEDGTLRVVGRLRNTVLFIANKHPVVLSAKPLSAPLASSNHVRLLHAGPQLLLVTLRQKFCILGGRNFMRSVFYKFRSKPTLVLQSTACQSRSFRRRVHSPCAGSTTVECGPFYIKSAVGNRGPTKVYLAFSVCFLSRQSALS